MFVSDVIICYVIISRYCHVVLDNKLQFTLLEYCNNLVSIICFCSFVRAYEIYMM
jgi:hypothetical protein